MSNDITQPDIAYQPIFVARQPIFTPERELWGYELLFRDGKVGAAHIGDPDLATSQVIADGISLGTAGVAPGSKFLINFPTKMLVEKSTLAIPKENCVVEILETVEATDDVLAALRDLKEQGYTLALDDFVGQDGFEEILKLADIVKVEVLGMPPAKLIPLTQRLKKQGVRLLAEKIEDQALFDMCKSLGYIYFQGYFFSKPEVIEGRKVPMGQLAKLQLLHKLSSPDYNVKDVAQTIHADTSLSYRLLTYLNSASFSLTQKVSSIAQAVTILGHNPLKHWLMVVIVSDMNPSPRASELAFKSVQRGRFLNLMATHLGNKSPYPGETMFLLGLFSMLDALLNQPMDKVIAQMPLEDDLKQALIGEEGPARDWLDMAAAVEAAEWKNVAGLLGKYELKTEDTATNYAKAMVWTSEILKTTGPD